MYNSIILTTDDDGYVRVNPPKKSMIMITPFIQKLINIKIYNIMY